MDTTPRVCTVAMNTRNCRYNHSWTQVDGTYLPFTTESLPVHVDETYLPDEDGFVSPPDMTGFDLEAFATESSKWIDTDALEAATYGSIMRGRR